MTDQIFSYSSLDLYEVCPQLFKYHYEDGLVTSDDTLPARFGTWMIHWPITEWYRHGGVYTIDFDDTYERCVHPTNEELANKKYKPYTIKVARALFAEYTSRFQRDFDDYEVISVEELKQVGDYHAKADVVFRRKADGIIVPNDIKSSKWDFILDGAHVNNQFLGQMWVHGTLEGIVTLVNVETEMIERIPIKIDQAMMTRWWEEMRFRIEQVARSRALKVWPRNAPHSCTRFNRPCPMKAQCHG